MFVWNKPISKNDKNINLTIRFPNENDLDNIINDFNFELSPGVWNLEYIFQNIKDRKVIIEYSYIDDGQLICNSETYYI